MRSTERVPEIETTACSWSSCAAPTCSESPRAQLPTPSVTSPRTPSSTSSQSSPRMASESPAPAALRRRRTRPQPPRLAAPRSRTSPPAWRPTGSGRPRSSLPARRRRRTRRARGSRRAGSSRRDERSRHRCLTLPRRIAPASAKVNGQPAAPSFAPTAPAWVRPPTGARDDRARAAAARSAPRPRLASPGTARPRARAVPRPARTAEGRSVGVRAACVEHAAVTVTRVCRLRAECVPARRRAAGRAPRRSAPQQATTLSGAEWRPRRPRAAAQATASRSTTKTSGSCGLITPPAPRAP
jgi:hypothetical protein